MRPAATTVILRRLNASSRIDFGIEEVGGVAVGAELEVLEKAGILTRSGTLERVKCTLCDDSHFSEVEYLASPDDPNHSAYYDCPQGSRAWLAPDQLQKWTGTLAALGAALARALGTKGTPHQYRADLYELGRTQIAGVERDFYLAVNTTTGQAKRQSAGAPVAGLPLGSVVFVLTKNAHLMRYLGVTVVSLHEVMKVEVEGIAIDADLLETELTSRAAIPPTSEEGERPFRHSADYRTVNLHGRQFVLTPQQAAVVRALHEAYVNGTPELGQDYLLEEVLETTMKRVRDVFDGLKDWTALAAKGSKKDTFRLNI